MNRRSDYDSKSLYSEYRYHELLREARHQELARAAHQARGRQPRSARLRLVLRTALALLTGLRP